MDKSADPTTAAPMTQLALPDWLTPAPTMTSVELARLKRENEMVFYPALFDRVIEAIWDGSTLAAALREVPHFEVHHGRFKNWILNDEKRRTAYDEACRVRSYTWADKSLDHALASDSFEDVARSTLVVNQYKWLIASDNRKKFGETRQIEQNVTIDLGEAMAQAQARALSRDVIDVTPKEIER